MTPPVALAAFAAAGLAGSAPMRTGVMASLLAGAGFIVPFMFVYGPPLLLEGAAWEIVLACLTATLGVIALAASAMGYARRRLAVWERFVALAASLLLIFPGPVTDGTGLLAAAVVFFKGADAMGGGRATTEAR